VSPPPSRVTVEVRVELKPGVFDAEGDGILKSLRLLKIDHLVGVGTARVYRLEFDGIEAAEAERLAARAVDRLLANPVVHRVVVGPATG
jgi:phosphoribosylformylglycinamidine synthase PurS subunit